MRIHILSDLHNELSPFTPAPVAADVVVLAGDIDVGARGVEWARRAFDCPVLYVPGNHEYYGGALEETRRWLREAADERVRVLDFDEVVLGGVRFLGVTAWTDYRATGEEALARQVAQQRLSDFRQIRWGDGARASQAEDFAALADRAHGWLRESLAQPFAGPTVVISHHAPSLRSIAGHPHAGTPLDAAFVNAWDELMGEGLDLWIHGHTHYPVDYQFGGTRVISNPRGYESERIAFDPGCVVTLEESGVA
ncbi:metallophosphoesterase [Azotobacter vinelandii]